MEQVVLDNAIGAVGSLSSTVAGTWFAAVRAGYEDADESLDWDTYEAGLLVSGVEAGVGKAAVEEFLEHLDDGTEDGLAVIAALLAEYSNSELVVRHAEVLEQSTEESAEEPAAEDTAEDTEDDTAEAADDDPWSRFFTKILQVHGPTYDGTEAHWKTFGPWLQEMGEHEGVGESAAQFVAYVDAAEDKPKAFDDYGIHVPDPWQRFLDEVLTVHGREFTGTDADWQAFGTMLLRTAEPLGLTEPASRFTGFVDTQPDKAAAFAQYGITIAVPATAPVLTPQSEDAELADAMDPDTAPPVEELDEKGRLVLDESDLDEDLMARLMRVQDELDLLPDGVVGPKTWDALAEFMPAEDDEETDDEQVGEPQLSVG